jgi:hypothetical protein
MPIVNRIFVVYRDEEGEESTRYFEVPTSVSAANLGDTTSALVALIVPLINGGITRAGYTVEVVTTPNPQIAAGAEIQRNMVALFRTAAGKLKRIAVPTFKNDLFLPGSKELDRSDADVDAFLSAMQSGIDVGGSTVTFVDSNNSDLVTVETTREEFTAG